MKAMSSPCDLDRGRHAAGHGQLLWRHDMAQPGHAGLQQASDDHRLGHRHQQRGAGVVEDAGVPQHVLLELRCARRRVDRYRNSAGAQDAQVGAEVLGRRRQHDGHALARLHAGLLQAGRDGRARVGELAVAERLLGAVGQTGQVAAIGVLAQMPLEHVEQGLRAARGFVGGGGGRVGSGRRRLGRVRGRSHRADGHATGRPLGMLAPRPAGRRPSRHVARSRPASGCRMRARCATATRCAPGCRSRGRGQACWPASPPAVRAPRRATREACARRSPAARARPLRG